MQLLVQRLNLKFSIRIQCDWRAAYRRGRNWSRQERPTDVIAHGWRPGANLLGSNTWQVGFCQREVNRFWMRMVAAMMGVTYSASKPVVVWLAIGDGVDGGVSSLKEAHSSCRCR